MKEYNAVWPGQFCFKGKEMQRFNVNTPKFYFGKPYVFGISQITHCVFHAVLGLLGCNFFLSLTKKVQFDDEKLNESLKYPQLKC